jgi:hypothetical protein
MTYSELIARISFSTLQVLKKCYNFSDAVLSGFWLGLMSEKSLDNYDDLHYLSSQKYYSDDYNLSGLARWEKERIETYFSGAKKILLIGAGGGRETYALSKMGFDVESYECNMALVEYGNEFLFRNGINQKIKYLAKNSVPGENVKYDGIIIGWGAYSHIRGKKIRLSFLSKLHPLLSNEAPLMISFVTSEGRSRQDKITKKVSGFFRSLSGRDKTETGDRLMSCFIHYFTEEEIKQELLQSKFTVIDYYNKDYGCIIAIV